MRDAQKAASKRDSKENRIIERVSYAWMFRYETTLKNDNRLIFFIFFLMAKDVYVGGAPTKAIVYMVYRRKPGFLGSFLVIYAM